MSALVLLASITQENISINDLAYAVQSPECGAVVTFSGNVRNHDGGKEVAKLIYEIHPSSQTVLQEVTQEVAARYENIRCAVAHRYGEIPIGESALAIAVATHHRGDAFSACAELVDEIKSRIPIWKHQVFSDGSDEWVNSA